MKTAFIVTLLVLCASVHLSEAWCGRCPKGGKCVKRCPRTKTTAHSGGYVNGSSKYGKVRVWNEDKAVANKNGGYASSKQSGWVGGFGNHLEAKGHAVTGRRGGGVKTGAAAHGGAEVSTKGKGYGDVHVENTAYSNDNGSGASSESHAVVVGKGAKASAGGHTSAHYVG